MKNIKHFLFGVLFLSTVTSVQAQVKFNLSLMQDNKTYLVSFISEKTWTEPTNMVGSIQVVIRVDANQLFQATNIQTLVEGLSWSDNAYLDNTESDPTHNYVAFVLNEKATKLINFTEGVETPLFTFKNVYETCAGVIELTANDDPWVKQVVGTDHINVTQNISVLGARGNAFSGIANGTTDCSSTVVTTNEVRSIQNLEVFPVPANNNLQLKWSGQDMGKNPKIKITNTLGGLVSMHDVSPSNGTQSLSLDVSNFQTGLYAGTFMNENGRLESFRFLVIHQ
jgi:hypothetical protein